MGITQRLLTDYDHEVASTRRLLTRLPDDKLPWSPHEHSRSLGGLVTHLVEVLGWAGFIVNGSTCNLEQARAMVEPLASRAAILAAFDDAASQTRVEMDRSDAEYEALWSLKRGTTELFVMPREHAFRIFVLHHMIHHRGQLSLYMRLADVAVPVFYGAIRETL